MIKIGINGLGRIGRCVVRAIHEMNKDNMQIVAINDQSPIELKAHLLKYDSVHGIFNADIEFSDKTLTINGQTSHLYSERNPADIAWGEHDVDVVMDCTGKFNTAEKAALHLQAGAKKVLVSSPAGSDVKTIVYGVNHNTLISDDKIVSNASCTTNCLAPIAKVLNDEFGIEQGLMTTIHALTNDQRVTDASHKDIRRARSGVLSMIPTKTGAATAVGLVLPELAGKLDGFAMRVPTVNVSVVDLSFNAKKPISVESINAAIQRATTGEMAGVLAINTLPLVSVDFNHNAASSIFDATQTRVIGNMAKVLSWYDNEWGFAVRMCDTAQAMAEA
jgi:glyceraldehyde 3-phosphate dehydrogenase